MATENTKNAFVLIDGRRQNKFVFKLLKDEKFRGFLRNKMKETMYTRAYSSFVCNMESPEITLSNFRSTCIFSALEWAENNDYDLLRMLENIKEILAPAESKKSYIFIKDKKYLLSCNKYESKLSTNFSLSKQGERYIEYQSGPHRMVRSASKLYSDSLFEIFGDTIPENIENRACELFSDEWKAYFLSLSERKYKLVIDDDFAKIYSSEYCKGNFGSCMEDSGFEGMYHAFEGAKACSLQDREGNVVARAILWERVYDFCEGEYYVYLDRQYSSDGRRDLKELLITKVMSLYKNENFLYKPSDCPCIASCNIYTSKGVRFFNAAYLRVKSSLSADDIVCYMDTFKFLNVSNGDCYTVSPSEDANVALLETTNGEIELDREWSSYEDEYIPRNEAVYSAWYDDYIWDYHAVWSERLTSYVNEDDESLVKINGDFYSVDNDDVVWIEYDGCYHLKTDDNIVYCEDSGIWTHCDNAFYYEPDDSWYEYEDEMPSLRPSPHDEDSNEKDDNTEEDSSIEKEKSVRIIDRNKEGELIIIEFSHFFLTKSEENFLFVIETYGIGGLDWYDANNVLRLYTESAMEGAICRETWRANLQRQIEICKKNIEYRKKKEGELCTQVYKNS